MIGLTGGIAMGKSVVLSALAGEGVRTASADQVAREVLSQPDVEAQVAGLAGLAIPLDRGELRLRLADPQFRQALNRLLHPLIWDRLEKSGAEVVETPLLLEACLTRSFEQVWVVSCSREEQIRRLTERLGSEERALQMAQLQLPARCKEAFADHVIRTDQPLDSVLLLSRNLAQGILAARSACL